jgi:hypothetical protein
LFQRREIDRKRFFGAERFARTIRFDRAFVDPAAKVVELDSELAEKIDKFRP